ncbi:MAG TPA: putative Se/S carrier-like protein [Candidatus Elarobacter sp.]
MANVILRFPSNSGTMIATKALRDSGVQANMIPTPTSVQSASNLCLSIEHAVEATALAALKVAKVSVSTIVR